MFQLTALSSQLTFDITTANADGYIQVLPGGQFATVD
jgi:phage I-like protein